MFPNNKDYRVLHELQFKIIKYGIKKRKLEKGLKCERRAISGTTGLASGWSEWTGTAGPSEPLASLTSPLNMTAAWDLTVKRPFTDQPDKGGSIN